MTHALLKIVGVVWIVGAIATLGFFAANVTQILPSLQSGLRASPAAVKHLIAPPAENPAATRP